MAQATGLRVSLVHSFYSSAAPSGENQAVFEQAEALQRAGHEVQLVAARTDELQRDRLYPLRAAVTVATGRGRSPLPELRDFAPDVVHVHNLFPNFGRRWAAEWGGPLVTTLHNFRPVCANACLFRQAEACTRCLDGDRWAGLRNGCYRGSRAATLPLAWASRDGAAGDPLLKRADRVLVLSELSRSLYLRAGIPEARMEVVPNFVASPPPVAGCEVGDRWVYVGRLSAEKGILELLRRWPENHSLDVVGSGELLDQCSAAAPASVRFLGPVDRAELRRRLPSWRGLVFPSRCFENAPLVYPEALAAGLPVLAFDGSSVAESVRAHGTGTVISWTDALDAALTAAGEHFLALRDHCRATFTERCSEARWVERIAGIYADAR